MNKNLKKIIISIIFITMFISTGAYAAVRFQSIKAILNAYSFKVNGTAVKISSINYNKVVYVPINTVSQLMGYNLSQSGYAVNLTQKVNVAQLQKDNTNLKANVAQLQKDNADLKTKVANLEAQLNAQNTSTTPDQTSSMPMSSTIKDVTIKLNKVVQDSDSLKIYVTYINNSKSEAMTGDCLTKVVSNGKQYEFDSEFNFDRYYETGVAHAADFIEPTVSADSVIFLRPIADVGTINIVLNSNFEEYRFNNVKVDIQ